MAAPLLLLLALVLVASGGAAGRDNGAWLPRLELRGIDDAPLQGQDLVGDYLEFTHGQGCGRFAALLAASANASGILRERIAAGGMTLFYPDDVAVAAFEPTFNGLSAEDQVAVLLHHAAGARYDLKAQLTGFDCVAVPTLAVADARAITNKNRTVLVRDNGDTLRLWPAWPQDSVARVRKTVVSSSSSEAPLVLYVVDAVLLRQKMEQDGGGEVAACTPVGGYVGWADWLRSRIPRWIALWLAIRVQHVLIDRLMAFFDFP